MKIIKIVLTGILVVGFIMPGCLDDPGCDCSAISKFFDIEGINLGVGEQVGTDLSAAYQWQDFRGQIAYQTTYYGDLQQENQQNKFLTFSLIPTASACSCPPDGWKGSEEGIDSLIITTTYDYNAAFPAGSDLSNILELNFEGDNYELHQDFIVRNDIAIFEQQHIYRLLQAPSNDNTPFQLTVEVMLDNGEVYEATTEEIVLSL